MKIVKKIAHILVLIGALNWGLVGVFNFDLVAYLFGPMTPLTNCVYTLVGIAAIITICCKHFCKHDHKSSM